MSRDIHIKEFDSIVSYYAWYDKNRNNCGMRIIGLNDNENGKLVCRYMEGFK